MRQDYAAFPGGPLALYAHQIWHGALSWLCMRWCASCWLGSRHGQTASLEDLSPTGFGTARALADYRALAAATLPVRLYI